MEDEDLERLYEEDDDYDDAKEVGVRVRKVPTGDLYEAARAGDVERVRQLLLEGGVNVNARDRWDSAPLYYACLAGHVPTARLLLESGAICAEHTFDGDRCHYAALNLGIRALLKSFEQRPPPLPPLHSALRSIFFSCPSNRPSSLEIGTTNEQFNYYDFASDITFFVQGRPIEAHRAILVARSPFFRLKFETDWKYRKEIRFSKRKLLYAALYSLIHFFYCDRLEIAVDDMENLVRICKVCKCDGLRHSLEKELNHQKYAEYKSLEGTDNSQKRFILHGVSLPEEERLPAAMHKLLRTALEKAAREMKCLQACFFESSAELPHNIERTSMVLETCINGNTDVRRHGDGIGLCSEEVNRKEWDTYSDISFLFQEHLEENGEDQDKELGLCYSQHTSEVYSEDHADVCFVVEGRKFRSHQVILASRSEYFKARLSRATLFLEGKVERQHGALTLLEEHDLSSKAFEILLEYMYTDTVKNVDPELAEEMFDAASRYLIFSLKRAVADALLPHLENALPAELCQWLMLSDLYGVWKIREYCLDAMAFNFEVFAEASEFREMLLRLPPPSGDSSERTTIPSAPGEEGKSNDANILDDMRDKWLEAEAAELDKRDESALQFDKRLEMLIQQAEHENRQQKSQLV